MNRFLYAEANPATFVDPDGHVSLCKYGSEDCGQLTESTRKASTWSGPTGTQLNTVAAAKQAAQADAETQAAKQQSEANATQAAAYVNPWALDRNLDWQKMKDSLFNTCVDFGDQAACDALSGISQWEHANRTGFCDANVALCAQIKDAQGQEQALLVGGFLEGLGTAATGGVFEPLDAADAATLAKLGEVGAKLSGLEGASEATAVEVARLSAILDEYAPLIGDGPVAIGSSRTYRALAQAGYDSFQVPDSMFSEALNDLWVQRVIHAGRDVLLSSDPAEARQGGGYERELNQFMEAGYTLDPSGWRLIAP